MKIRKSFTLGILAISLILAVYAESTNVKIANNLLTNNVITPQGYDDESIYVTITYYASKGNFSEKIWHQEVRNGKVYSGYLNLLMILIALDITVVALTVVTYTMQTQLSDNFYILNVLIFKKKLIHLELLFFCIHLDLVP